MKLSFALLFIFLTGCSSLNIYVPSASTKQAWNVFDANIKKFEHYLDEYKSRCDNSQLNYDSCGFGNDSTINLIVFFSKTTGIESSPLLYSFAGACYQSYNQAILDFQKWEQWYYANKRHLYLGQNGEIKLRINE